MSTVKAYFPSAKNRFLGERGEGEFKCKHVTEKKEIPRAASPNWSKVCGSETDISWSSTQAVVKEQKSRNNPWVTFSPVGLGHLIHLQSSNPHIPPLFQVRQPQFSHLKMRMIISPM